MGRELADTFPAARETFDAVDAALGTPLSRLCFEGPAEELTLTHNAQPALYAHGAAAWAVVRAAVAGRVVAAAGHSLGEFTAYHAAGTLTLPDGARLVRRRGELMLAAGEARPGAMAAVLGDLAEPIETLCERATAEAGLVVPANYNAPGQLVVSGDSAGVDRLAELAKEAGARRAMRLNVSGAFHSPLMQPAAEGLGAALGDTNFATPAFPVASNVTAELVSEGDEARALLERQLTSPVRWTDLVRMLAARHSNALFVELGPGNVLAGLMKRIAPEVATATCGTPAEVESLLQRLG